jgi:hypothetical protein
VFRTFLLLSLQRLASFSLLRLAISPGTSLRKDVPVGGGTALDGVGVTSKLSKLLQFLGFHEAPAKYAYPLRFHPCQVNISALAVSWATRVE